MNWVPCFLGLGFFCCCWVFSSFFFFSQFLSLCQIFFFFFFSFLFHFYYFFSSLPLHPPPNKGTSITTTSLSWERKATSRSPCKKPYMLFSEREGKRGLKWLPVSIHCLGKLLRKEGESMRGGGGGGGGL